MSAELPLAEFGFPGPLRERLVEAILAGEKVSTTGLLEEYRREGTAVGEPGDRELVVDSEGRGVAVIETTHVEVRRNGVVVATTPNDGSHTDRLDQATGTFRYRVAHPGGQPTSNEVTVVF